jgi:adenine C2-methylase RlmN of 23S rRNA A2503 and tRNA A37
MALLTSQVYSLLLALPRVRMAFSVHCADDATRSRLMPINRRANLPLLLPPPPPLPLPLPLPLTLTLTRPLTLTLTLSLTLALTLAPTLTINRRVPLVELAAAMRHYLERTKRRLTVQYVLLRGVNDSTEHAAFLAAFLLTVGPAERFHLNLIPYNAQSRPSYQTPSPQAAAAF